MSDRCELCRFWKRDAVNDEMYAPGTIGECVRYPPSSYLQENDDPPGDCPLYWRNPAVAAFHWCGEFQARKPAEKEPAQPPKKSSPIEYV